VSAFWCVFGVSYGRGYVIPLLAGPKRLPSPRIRSSLASCVQIERSAIPPCLSETGRLVCQILWRSTPVCWSAWLTGRRSEGARFTCQTADLRRRMAANPTSAVPSRASEAGSGTVVETSDWITMELAAATPKAPLTSCHSPVSTAEPINGSPAVNALKAAMSVASAPFEMKATWIRAPPRTALTPGHHWYPASSPVHKTLSRLM
jgi:hypothetical protein